jgi:hypothetical protein
LDRAIWVGGRELGDRNRHEHFAFGNSGSYFATAWRSTHFVRQPPRFCNRFAAIARKLGDAHEIEVRKPQQEQFAIGHALGQARNHSAIECQAYPVECQIDPCLVMA